MSICKQSAILVKNIMISFKYWSVASSSNLQYNLSLGDDTLLQPGNVDITTIMEALSTGLMTMSVQVLKPNAR